MRTLLGVKYASMPSMFSRPRFRADRRKIVPTAVALYREMGEAMAAGDRDTLKEICVPSLFHQLTASIDKRNPKTGQRYLITEQKQSRQYPRLTAMNITGLSSNQNFQQATVAIYNTVELQRFNKETGEVLDRKVQSKIEYVVINRKIHTQTYETTPWKLWGTRSPTTMEDWRKELLFVNKGIALQAQGRRL